MFNKNGKSDSTSQSTFTGNSSPSINIVGPGTKIEGEIHSKGDIRVDGVVTGMITSESKVVIGPKGFVEGDIFCESADISGKVNGKVDIKGLLFLKDTARLSGEINTQKLVVESGALMSGNCRVGDYKEIKREKPAASGQLNKATGS